MSKYIFITNQNKNNDRPFFHPFLLDFYNHHNVSAIIPILNKFKDKKIISSADNIQNIQQISYDEMNSIYFSNKYFLLANFYINDINDIYNVLNELIINKNNIKTINNIFEIIFSVFKKDFDDINIDKIISIYILYFQQFYNKTIEYYKIFSSIKNNIDNDNIHKNIIKIILS